MQPNIKFDKPFKTTEGLLIMSVKPPSGTSHIQTKPLSQAERYEQ